MGYALRRHRPWTGCGMSMRQMACCLTSWPCPAAHVPARKAFFFPPVSFVGSDFCHSGGSFHSGDERYFLSRQHITHCLSQARDELLPVGVPDQLPRRRTVGRGGHEPHLLGQLPLGDEPCLAESGTPATAQPQPVTRGRLRDDGPWKERGTQQGYTECNTWCYTGLPV